MGLDVWADGAARALRGGRAQQSLEPPAHDGEVVEASLELGHLGADHRAHMRAGESACPANRDDLLDLGQGESQPTRPGDELEDADRVAVIDPIAGRRPRGQVLRPIVGRWRASLGPGEAVVARMMLTGAARRWK